MPTIRKAARIELDDIAAQMVVIDEQQAKLKDQRGGLTKRFLELAVRHIEEDGKSRVWPVPQFGKRVRVTQAEPTIPVDYDKFMRDIGPELFAQVCKVKTAELDVERWNGAVTDERAKDSQLEKCVGESKSRAPGIYVENIPKEAS